MIGILLALSALQQEEPCRNLDCENPLCHELRQAQRAKESSSEPKTLNDYEMPSLAQIKQDIETLQAASVVLAREIGFVRAGNREVAKLDPARALTGEQIVRDMAEARQTLQMTQAVLNNSARQGLFTHV
jgi:hypothetical protein